MSVLELDPTVPLGMECVLPSKGIDRLAKVRIGYVMLGKVRLD
jgi:hypothetical protein